MRFVALVSGGKDSVFSIGKCLAHGHTLVCLANLYPPATGPEELDSFMFQSAGAVAIECLAECLEVPLIRAPMSGRSGHRGLHYAPTEGDEVEDLYELIRHVKERYPDVEAVASGAVLSTYQRTRVESVCERLGLQSLAFLWQYDQATLLEEMVSYGMEAVLVKVASAGLMPHKHLGKTVAELLPVFQRLHAQYGFHVAGEGGEYETLTLDAPFFTRRLVLDRTEVVLHSDDLYAPVGLLRVLGCHTEPKDTLASPPLSSSSVLAPLVLPPGGERLLPSLSSSLALAATAAEEAEEESSRGETRRKKRLRPPASLVVGIPRPHVWAQGRQLLVSGVSVPTPPPPAVGGDDDDNACERQMGLCLRALASALAACGASMEDVVFVHLYLRSMQQFAAANAVYCRDGGFLASHPPSRSCIEAPLPHGVEVRIDAFALRGSGRAMREGEYQARQVLHVKSLSGWAPLCIGPYSQANLLGQGHLLLLAGQIGLSPTSMALVGPSPRFQACQALYNVAAVLAALRSSIRAGAMVVAYVKVGHEEEAEEEEGGGGDWDASVAAWRRLALDGAGYGRRTKPPAAAAADDDDDGAGRGTGSPPYSDYGEEEEGEEEGGAPPLVGEAPFLVVGVPELPKGAAVEFEVTALSTMLASRLRPTGSRWAVPAAAALERGGEEAAVPDVLPRPFQPSYTNPAPPSSSSSSSSSSPYAVAAEAMHLPYALAFLHLALRAPRTLPPKSQTQEADTTTTLEIEIEIDYRALARAALSAVGRGLTDARLTWRQLSRLRLFYPAGVVEEGSLRAAVAGAMATRAARAAAAASFGEEEEDGGGDVATTYVPVARLEGGGEEEEEGFCLLRVQAVALDLEKLRTEAWVHEVSDGGI